MLLFILLCAELLCFMRALQCCCNIRHWDCCSHDVQRDFVDINVAQYGDSRGYNRSGTFIVVRLSNCSGFQGVMFLVPSYRYSRKANQFKILSPVAIQADPPMSQEIWNNDNGTSMVMTVVQQQKAAEYGTIRRGCKNGHS